MIVDEPLYQDWLDARPGIRSAIYIVVIAGVLGVPRLRAARKAKEVLQ
jgi:hypothetical protein